MIWNISLMRKYKSHQVISVMIEMVVKLHQIWFFIILLFQAENSFGDISGKVVADFGCGCGTLGVASALLGAEWVLFHSCWVTTSAFFSESVILLYWGFIVLPVIYKLSLYFNGFYLFYYTFLLNVNCFLV